MKTLTNFKSKVTLLGAVLLTLIIFGCSKDDDVAKPMYLPANTSTSKQLNAGEKEGLLYLVENEKMLMDVYNELAANTQIGLMKDLATTKQHHMLLLSARIDKYGLENPLNGLSAGDYKNPLIQQRYDNIRISQPTSESEAIALAKNLETSLLSDLNYYLNGIDGHPDIASLYNKIIDETGSYSMVFGRVFPGYENITAPDDTNLDYGGFPGFEHITRIEDLVLEY